MRSFLLMRLCDWVIVIISYFFLFMNADLMKKEIKRKWLIWLYAFIIQEKERKKLNMQDKGNMVFYYFIINIHMQLRRRGLDHNSSNSYSLHEIHEEIEDERKQITHIHILLTQEKEAPWTYYKGTHICIDINTQKEGSSSSILSNSYSFVNL